MKTKPATAATPPAATVASQADDITAKLQRLAAENTALCQELQQHFGPERWARIRAQCEARIMVLAAIEATAAKALRCTRQMEPYHGNARAALVAGANHFLCLIGSAPAKADLAALEEALKAASRTDSAAA